MSTQKLIAVPAATFTDAEWQTLHALQRSYQQDRDLFSDAERERLRFLRWLYGTKRLMP